MFVLALKLYYLSYLSWFLTYSIQITVSVDVYGFIVVSVDSRIKTINFQSFQSFFESFFLLFISFPLIFESFCHFHDFCIIQAYSWCSTCFFVHSKRFQSHNYSYFRWLMIKHKIIYGNKFFITFEICLYLLFKSTLKNLFTNRQIINLTSSNLLCHSFYVVHSDTYLFQLIFVNKISNAQNVSQNRENIWKSQNNWPTQ